MNKLRLYVPGMFSLFLLFPLLMYQVCEWDVFRQHKVLEVAWYDPDAPWSSTLPPPPRNYSVIDLSGNAFEDDLKIQYAKLLVHKMAYGWDTTRGIRIHFSDTSRYQTLIDVLDICNQYTLTYAAYENNFSIFYQARSERPQPIAWRGRCIVNTMIPADDAEMSRVSWSLTYSVEAKFWPLAGLLILLAVVGLRRKVLSRV